ncbi:MAG: LicD family protein [Muribaculaceae bacterium]|nr:LicD family protein [Muribaculaceae bacterium]
MNDHSELTIKEKQSIILDIMKDIDRFCRSNGIPYTISSGTLLGAVRHGGFIPWDDDADMFMLRDDFERFIRIYKSDRYKLVFNFEDGDKSSPSGIAKIADVSTGSKDSAGQLDYGVWVDVFPLESVPEDPDECHKFMHKILRVNNRLYHRRKHDLLSIIKSYHHSYAWWLKRLNEIVHDNPYTDSPLVAHAVGSSNYRTVIPKKWFDDLGEIRFEDYDFMAFRDTDSYLTKVYGPDYMTPKKWNHDVKVYRKDVNE